jgi:hypothetical protein
MIKRGYSDGWKLRNPTYKDCTVSEEWYLFSIFRAWMVKQDWKGSQLDKDLLISGNRAYSPDACVFVSRQVNMFLIDSGASRGDYKIGVCWHKQNGKFMARCRNPFTCKQEYLGLYTDEDQAHKAWLDRKIEHAYALAGAQTDERVCS